MAQTDKLFLAIAFIHLLSWKQISGAKTFRNNDVECFHGKVLMTSAKSLSNQTEKKNPFPFSVDG